MHVQQRVVVASLDYTRAQGVEVLVLMQSQQPLQTARTWQIAVRKNVHDEEAWRSKWDCKSKTASYEAGRSAENDV